MKKVVADASLCGAWILPDEASAAAEALLEELLAGSSQLVVPALWHYEMANMLRAAYQRGRLTKAGLKAAGNSLGRVPIHEVDVSQGFQHMRIIDYSLKFGLSAYDAAYLELADRLKVSLLTSDKALGKAYQSLTR